MCRWRQRRYNRSRITDVCQNHQKVGERRGRESSSQHSEGTNPVIQWSQTSSLHHSETMDFCSVSHLVCNFCYGRSQKTWFCSIQKGLRTNNYRHISYFGFPWGRDWVKNLLLINVWHLCSGCKPCYQKLHNVFSYFPGVFRHKK